MRRTTWGVSLWFMSVFLMQLWLLAGRDWQIAARERYELASSATTTPTTIVTHMPIMMATSHWYWRSLLS